MITPQLMLSLLFILMTAWGIGSLFARYGLPFVLGELLAGVLIGPPPPAPGSHRALTLNRAAG
jgi:Kef-type K+ transport system membrane component KefB